MPDESLVAKLKSEVAAGRVVVIAGTGVSVAASGNPLVDGHQVATWTGLLEHGVAYGLCRGLLDDFDTKFLPMQIASARVDYMVKAAETLAERLSVGGGSAYLDWLADSVGVLKVTDPAVPQAVAALGGLLATLNYDGLLEEVTGWPAVTWQQRDAVQQVLRREAKGVLHLHGWWQSPETVVLGLRSYDQVRDDEHANGVRQLLAMGQTMVFIGCNSTLSDPNFTALIDWCKSALAGVRAHHFVLCCQAELAGVRAMLDGAPWFQPVVYGESYGGLAPFLRSLAPAQVDTGMPSSVRRALDLGAYREAMIKQYGHLSLEYVDSTTYDTRELLLTGMFVEQEDRKSVV